MRNLNEYKIVALRRMNPYIEYTIIGITAGWAGFYLIRKIYRTFKPSDNGCGGSCGCAAAELQKNKKVS